MRYKASCPSCGTKISRGFIVCEPTISHICRCCGARLGMAFSGWICIFAFIAVQVLWFVMARRHIVSGLLAIALLVVTCALTVWLAPYIIAAEIKPGVDKHEKNGLA
jgi:hypothetical protein